MKHKHRFVGSTSFQVLSCVGVIGAVIAIVAIGLASVTQSTKAGMDVLAHSNVDNTVSGSIRPEEDAAVLASEVRRETFDRLRAAAATSTDGMTRAIVGLDAAFEPVGSLSEDRLQQQLDGIKKAQTDLISSVRSARIDVVHKYEYVPFMLVTLDEAGLTQLQNDPKVLTIEEDTLAESHLAESSPVVSAPASWAAGFDGTGWEVAVLDTGVNKHHDFFGVGPPTKIVSEACYSNTEPASGASSLCPGGATSSTAVDSGMNCTGFAGCEHGTHAAGVVAGNNGTNGSGVGRGANIIAIQVFRAYTAAACGGESPCTKTATSDQLRALERVLFLTTPGGGSRRIAAVNMSLGGLPLFPGNTECDAANASRKAAIDNLRSVGVATVISSGNDGNIFGVTAPACISTAVSVGSTVDSGIDLDGVSSFSNSFFGLSLLAPGDTITSSTGFGNPSNVFTGLSGTSFAAPHVAGAFAVLRQAAPNLPNATSVGTILNALRTGGKPVRDFRNGVLTPRIDVDVARRLLQGLPTPTPTPPPPTPTPQPPGPTCITTGVLGTAPAGGGTTGNLAARLFQGPNPSTCEANDVTNPVAPGTYIYNTHRFANTSTSPRCVTVTLTVNAAGTAPTDLQMAAQLAPFVPADLGSRGRYLNHNDQTSGTPPVARSLRVIVPAGASFDVLIFSVNGSPAGQGAQYTLHVTGLPSCPDGTQVPDIPAILFADATGEEGPPGPGPSHSPSGGATIDFPITLSAPSDQIVTALVSTNGITATEEGDFVGLEEIEVVFPPFTTTRTISVTTIEDPGDEPHETFSLDLISVSNASVGDGQGIGTILDDDPSTNTVQFSAASYIGDESQVADTAEHTVVTVTRTGVTTGVTTVTANVSAVGTANVGASCAGNADIQFAAPVVLTFAAGETSKTFTVPNCPDMLYEIDETGQLVLSAPTGGGIGAQSTTTLIVNDTANQYKNSAGIDIFPGPGPAPESVEAVGSPYPSNIVVTGAPTNVHRVRVTLYDMYHALPDNLDILLVSPTGRKMVIMGDSGGAVAIPETGKVTITFADQAGQVLPNSNPLSRGKFEPTTWEAVVGDFPLPAPIAPYDQPGSTVGGVPTLYTTFGQLDGNGTWSLYVRDDNGAPGPAPEAINGRIAAWGLELLAATAAGVEVSGRVMTPDGRGLRNAVVSMVDSQGITRTATTGSFGYYTFEDVEVGATYVVAVQSRRYRFAPRIIQVFDSLTDVDFTGQE